MKLKLIILLFLSCHYPNTAWLQNLVPNPSFEQYTNCPNPTGGITGVLHWIDPCPSSFVHANYFSSCITNACCDVPSNIFGYGYQYAKTGRAYIGMFVIGEYGMNFRNYVQAPLISNLILGKKYYVEFFVNLANTADYCINNISLLFTNYAIPQPSNGSPIIANAQVYNFGNPIIPNFRDTLSWLKISGVYKAVGIETHLTIGNFTNDINTDTLGTRNTAPDNRYGGYYIDDVSVIPLDSMCLKANAGTDKNITLGDSAFIGSYTNGIDSILWLQNGTIKIDSSKPGFFVKPIASTFYVLQQTVNGCTTRDTVYVNVNLMPLKFTSFSVISTKEKSVTLSWTTADETNVSHFDIQCCENGKEFKTIATTKARNNITNEYSFFDKDPTRNEKQETLYYRIEAIDFDGRKTYSVTKQIMLNNLSVKPLNVFPNPAKEFITISSKEKIKAVRIVDMFGRQISQQELRNDMQVLTLNIQHLTKGMYIVKVVTTTGNTINEKFLIQ